MIWPGWTEAMPLMTMLIGLVGSLVGMGWVLMRLFRPIARDAARDATDDLKKDLEVRMDGMKTDLEGRVSELKTDLNKRMDGIDARLDRMDGRMSALATGIEELKRLALAAAEAAPPAG